jgi:hypothetical protein
MGRIPAGQDLDERNDRRFSSRVHLEQLHGKGAGRGSRDAFPGSDESGTENTNRNSESITVTICDASGMLATPNCPSTHQRTYTRGEEPSSYCTIHNAQNSRKVPNVVGMSGSAARSAIESMGYSPTLLNQASNEPAGTVVGQAPAAGTVLPAGSSVTVYVSTGAPQSSVPSVVGLTEPATRTKIAAAGFSASVSYVAGSPPDTVVSQSPSAGARMALGSTVSISVSRGGGGLSAHLPWLF